MVLLNASHISGSDSIAIESEQVCHVSHVQGMKSKQIYSSSRRRNLKGPEIQFYKTNCFLNHPFDSVVDEGNDSTKLSTEVDVVLFTEVCRRNLL